MVHLDGGPARGTLPREASGKFKFLFVFLVFFWEKPSSHQSLGTGMGSVGSGEERDIDMAPEMKSV